MAIIVCLGCAAFAMLAIAIFGGIFELVLKKSRVFRTLYEDFYFRCRGEELRK